MKVLAITNLFPNAREPNRGCFNLQQFAALARHCELRVIAPIPWQPWAHGPRRPVPYQARWSGIPAIYPFHFYSPGVGRAAYALWMYASLRRTAMRAAAAYRPDVLLATWAYPDAVAAAALARRLALPWVAKAHGSDINVYAAVPALRRQIRWALRQASCVFAVSHPMKQQLVAIGIPADAVRVQHNGVDTARFRLADRAGARRALGLPLAERIVLYVGNLKVSKGVADLIEAARCLAAEPERPPLILFAGGGPDRETLAEQVRRHGLGATVRLVGPRPHAEVPDWIAAADALCLPSHAEGCPNVVLEALACGRPVVATRVGAVPDLIDDHCGALVPPRAPEPLAAALRAVLARAWDPAALRDRVHPLSWEENARVLAAELERAAGVREKVGAGH